MAEKGCDYREAMHAVLAADKQLAQAYAAPASRAITRPAAPVPLQMSQGNPAGFELHVRAEKLVQEDPSLDYCAAVKRVLDEDRQLKVKYAGVQS
jgi:hypothetical protein